MASPALAQILDDLGLPEDSLDDWKCTVAQRNGKDVAIVITKGCEIHMASLTEKKAMSRKNILEFLSPIIREFGYATTRVPLIETDHSLRERLGFTHTWSDTSYSYWVMTDLPYQKAQP